MPKSKRYALSPPHLAYAVCAHLPPLTSMHTPRAGHWSSLRLLPHVRAPYHGNLCRTQRRRNLRASPQHGSASSASRHLRPSSGASPPHGPGTCSIARLPHTPLAAAPAIGILAHALRCYAAGSWRHQRRLHAGHVPHHVHAHLGKPFQPPPMPFTAQIAPSSPSLRVPGIPTAAGANSGNSHRASSSFLLQVCWRSRPPTLRAFPT
jgi:hypothetical protein